MIQGHLTPIACCCRHDHVESTLLREQFNELTRPLIRHLLGHARSILHSEDLAWDAVQEALLGLWTKAQVGSQVLDYAGPWLCRAVVLRSLQISRQNGRRARHERGAATCRSELEECHALNGELHAKELKEIVEMAMASLPEEFRVVLELRTREGLDYAETAVQLGIPVGTVRSRLKRARTILQKVLQAVCDPPSEMTQSRGDEGACVKHSGACSSAKGISRNRIFHGIRELDMN